MVSVVVGFIMIFVFGTMVGILLGLKMASDTLGIPKGYKVGTVTFKKIDSESNNA
jgi:VIT1/CCC1 family predicted Fe2+/Mn2+ transporter